MHTQLTTFLGLWPAWLLLALAGLGGCSDDAVSCGPGTVAKGGRCVAVESSPTCGSGTVLQDGQCVLIGVDIGPDAAADAGADTGGEADTALQDTSDAGSTDKDADNKGTDAAAGSDTLAGTDAVEPDPEVIPPIVCTPDCSGKSCGQDGCGGSCGLCLNPDKPYCESGSCVATCVPKCTGKNCGDNGCGGTCGTCTAEQFCNGGQCNDVPSGYSCNGFCGGAAPSGCGCDAGCLDFGTCCPDFAAQCEGCVPSCLGKTCGSDGCGGSCGPCNGGSCQEGQCVTDWCGPSPCAGHGSCDPTDGACACNAGYTGKFCETCAPGYVDYPACIPDLCAGKNQSCGGHGSCLPQTGECFCDPGFVGSSCEACGAGLGTWPACSNPCGPGVNCDDGNACTIDSCNEAVGCVHTPSTAPCNDGDPCSFGEVCKSGSCTLGSKICDVWVNSTDDVDDSTCNATHCSLREAIATANADPANTIIGTTAGKLLLTAELPALTSPSTVVATSGQFVVDGGGQFRGLQTSAALLAANLLIENGVSTDGGAGIRSTAGKLTLQNCTIRDCQAAQSGGGIYAAGPVVLQASRLMNNSVTAADQHGGGLAGLASMELRESHLSGNVATGDGGAVYSTTGPLLIRRSSLTKNEAKRGGAVYAQAPMTVVNSTLASNLASESGGGIHASKLLAVHCALVGNSAPLGSGLFAASLQMRSCQVGLGLGGGKDCAATQLQESVTNHVQDGSCNASWQGPLGLGAQTMCGVTVAYEVGGGSPAVDAGQNGPCGDLLLDGVDQCGQARPVGDKCDVGAWEWSAK